MLTLAVGLTLIGFVLLVFALMAANFWLAVACIAVCVIGLVILLVDTIRAGKRGRAGVDDEPLFTIRGRESATRAEPLIDETETPGDAGSDEVPNDDAARGAPSADRRVASEAPTEAVGTVDDGFTPTWEGSSASGGLGSIVSPDAHGNAVAGPGSQPIPAAETGDAHDYIRSVTGSFPTATPTGQTPVADEPSRDSSSTAVPEQPEPGTASGRAPDAGSPAPDSTPFRTPAFDPPRFEPPAQEIDPKADDYVGRRRRIEQSESLVVNTSDPTLPAMQFVYHDTDADSTDSAETAESDDASANDESENK
ncbi:hypothetical protein [Gordonia humi]|uniref:Uncharacterized protein n=1 Tax=Gordonia humi TaxID=686429 RepID=A0A840F325_9ACTN|nr:hypothetical protein [Gordonia humi]MBB4136883.1 hypothetical protein [Gordonia humi]